MSTPEGVRPPPLPPALFRTSSEGCLQEPRATMRDDSKWLRDALQRGLRALLLGNLRALAAASQGRRAEITACFDNPTTRMMGLDDGETNHPEPQGLHANSFEVKRILLADKGWWSNAEELDLDGVVRKANGLGLERARRQLSAQSAALCHQCDEVPALARRHFTCGICLCPRWREAASAFALPCCRIEYCAECWGALASATLSTSDPIALRHVRCPTPYCRPPAGRESIGRHAKALTDGLESICKHPTVTDSARDSIKTLVRLHEDTSGGLRSRLCPSCHAFNRAPPSTVDIECHACETRFCFVHGDAHFGVCCGQYMNDAPMDADRREFARRMHTRRCPACMRSIVKSGGCDRMHCLCGHIFSWSRAPVEEPCSCLNLRDSRGALHWWGAPPCKGASGKAHAKLMAWRVGVLACAAPAAVLALPAIAVWYGAPALTTLWKVGFAASQSTSNAVQLRQRGIMPGSFEYNYYVHGDGRNRPIPSPKGRRRQPHRRPAR